MPGQSVERGTAVREPQAVGLVEKLEATREGMRAFQRARCLLTTGLVILPLAGLLAAADWLLVLSTPVRGLGLLALAGAALVLLARGLLGPGRRFGRQDAAAAVESAFPQLGQRVRTTLDYTEPNPDATPAAPGLVRALAADTGRRTRGLDFRVLVPWRSLWLPGAALFAVVAVFAVLLATSGERRTAALRLLLYPAQYTQLSVKPGDEKVKVGSDLAIQATLTGRPVKKAEVLSRPAGSADWTRVSLAPPDAAPGASRKLSGTLRTTLKDCRDDLEYRVVAGPVESPVYRVRILRPLVLKQVEAAVTPPAYTRKPPATVPEGNIKVIAGSKVGLRFTLDRAPQSARLVLHGDREPLPLEVRGNELTGELSAQEKDVEYEVAAEAADGMHLDANRFRIQVVPDRKPTVRFVKPQEQIEVTPTTEVHMRLEAADDFGLSALGVVYQVGDGEKKTLYLQRDPTQPTTLRAEVVLPLEEQQVTFPDSVAYYAFAEDNRPDPQRTTTELQFIDIRPYKRSYQLLDTGGT